MIIPPLTGKFSSSEFVVYTACDAKYFDEFAPQLVSSIKLNSDTSIHLHIFNPRADQLEYCSENNVSTTWEYITKDMFQAADQKLKSATEQQQHNTFTAMKKGHDQDTAERIQKTYYACARFIRLAELFNGTSTVFSIDVDAVVRKSIPKMKDSDFYIHYISGKKARYLAGGLYLNPTSVSVQFLKDYAQLLRTSIEQDCMYWGLDQDVLEQVMPKYKPGQLPMSLIDWNMHPDSCIWTAKGQRKELEVFVNEQKKYSS